MKLTVFNPTKDALKNLNGLNEIGANQYRNWNARGFCWTCSKDKPTKGGTRTGHKDSKNKFSEGSHIRFTCLDCLNLRAIKKVAASSNDCGS